MKYHFALKIVCLICLLTSCYENTSNYNDSKSIIDTVSPRRLEEHALDFLINNQVDTAIKLYLKAIQIIDYQEHSQLAKLYIDLGSCYFQNGDYTTSIGNLKKGLCFYFENYTVKQILDVETWAIGAFLLAGCYKNISCFDSAIMILDNFETSIDLYYSKNPEDNKYWIMAELYTRKALILSDLGCLEEAITNSINAIEILEKHDTEGCIISNNYSQLGDIFSKNEDFLKAEQYYLKAKQIIYTC